MRKRHSCYGVRVTRNGPDGPSCDHIPQHNCLIKATAGQERPCRVECAAHHKVGVALKHSQTPAGLYIPQPQAVVIGCSRQVGIVAGRPCNI